MERLKSCRWQGGQLGRPVPGGQRVVGGMGGNGGSPRFAAAVPGCLAAHRGDSTAWSQRAMGVSDMSPSHLQPCHLLPQSSWTQSCATFTLQRVMGCTPAPLGCGVSQAVPPMAHSPVLGSSPIPLGHPSVLPQRPAWDGSWCREIRQMPPAQCTVNMYWGWESSISLPKEEGRAGWSLLCPTAPQGRGLSPSTSRRVCSEVPREQRHQGQTAPAIPASLLSASSGVFPGWEIHCLID